MTILDHEHVDLQTPSGPMRTHLFRPAAAGKYPGIMLFSEIFQVTGPIRRTASLLASHGFVVVAPEIFHEYEPAGTVLGYDSAGSERGNWCKQDKPLANYDSDLVTLREFLKGYEHCTGALGSMGICIGGHMSFRNSFSPEVRAAACVYATDIHKIESHKRGLGAGMADDTLERARKGDVKAELLMIWGRQDPHVPYEGRKQIREALEQGNAWYQALEYNGAHAFIRDEGPRYNPVLAQFVYQHVVELFKRKLGEGDLPAAS
jgi:carboxymethylenebutenolidase